MTPESEPAEKQTPRVSVVIVSFNRAESVRESLETLGETHQVVVVDNASHDGTMELEPQFPAVRFVRLPKDFGLTKALNIGIRAAEGEYILLLHDDTRITPDAVTRLADYLETHPDAEAVCPLLTDESGNPVPQVRPLPNSSAPDPLFEPAQGGEEMTVDCVCGAAIMFRSFYLRALRQIDEHYGNYGSDIELCAQVRRSGKRIVILRDVKAVHGWLESPMNPATLAGDRAAGTAVFLGKHAGMGASIGYRITAALGALLGFRLKVLSGVLSGQKIDGTG